jgi:hypothetical protein
LLNRVDRLLLGSLLFSHFLLQTLDPLLGVNLGLSYSEFRCATRLGKFALQGLHPPSGLLNGGGRVEPDLVQSGIQFCDLPLIVGPKMVQLNEQKDIRGDKKG